MPFSTVRCLLSLVLGAPPAGLLFAAHSREFTGRQAFPRQSVEQTIVGDTADTAALAQQALMPLPHQQAARTAALQLATLAAVQHNDGAELRWRAVAFLEDEEDATGRAALYTQLGPLYTRVTAHGAAPDVRPGVLPPASHGAPDLDQYLDRQWQALYDRPVLFDSATETLGVGPPKNNRLVIGEYITAVECGSCGAEDRAERAVMRHFGPDRYLVLATHYFDFNPPSIVHEDLFNRLLEWYPTNGASANNLTLKPPVIPGTGVSKLPSGNQWIGVFVDGHQLPLGGSKAVARAVARVVAAELNRTPEAVVHIAVQPHGDTLVTQVRVDSITGTHARLAVRIALVEDTVRILGNTNRRLAVNVVRAAARAPGLPLGLPIASTGTSTVTYTFNLATLRTESEAQRDSLDKLTEQPSQDTKTLLDARNWQINPARLHIVAFVQDLETGEILQGARAPVFGPRDPVAPR